MELWDALATLGTEHLVFFGIALAVAFGFEFINGFHDTANAVTTVIYTKTLRPTPAVIYSGFLNFLGVLLGGTAVAFAIVHLLPVDLLVNSDPHAALVMVLSLLLAGVMWNLGTWYYGLPVSSSHTLIGSILGVGLMNSLLEGHGFGGVNWGKAAEVGAALLVSPLVGFVLAGVLLLLMKRTIREPRLYVPPDVEDHPPKWVRGVLLATCGGVSFAHGSNDGQKGMGLILLVLIGFLPAHYALDPSHPEKAATVRAAVQSIETKLSAGNREVPENVRTAMNAVLEDTEGKTSLGEIDPAKRWELRQAIYTMTNHLTSDAALSEITSEERKSLTSAIEFVPLWVVIGVAVALGVGTTVGYKRIVITVAEKIGKTHLTYAQGAAAETVAAFTILLADFFHMPVSTTHVLSSGVAGTMAANGSGVQRSTLLKIGLAWVFTLPAAMVLAAGLYAAGVYTIGRWIAG